MGTRFNAIKMKLLKLVVFAAAAVAQEVVASGNASAVGAADGERANPDVCGNVKAMSKDPLKFQCKKGKKGKSCKVKCTKAPKNKDTPKKIFCKNNKWSNKKGKEVYDLSKFGCEPKDDKDKDKYNGPKEPEKPKEDDKDKYNGPKKPEDDKDKDKYNGKPKEPELYKPVMECPWDKKDHSGDCGSKYPGKCNLKYFKVCGESFFNKVYNDVCKWQDAKQLIPMFTQKLVPLGNRFEKKNDIKCDAKNPFKKSNEELMGGIFTDDERDIPKCDAEAGIVPCDMVDFSGVTTARQFHLKVEKLYHDYLKKHCNQEWQVHFDALLILMRNSLFCDDGSDPDHEGYTPSPPPPVYKPDEDKDKDKKPDYNPDDNKDKKPMPTQYPNTTPKNKKDKKKNKNKN